MEWKIDDVPIFTAVVEEHGISAAADRLAMPKSTVSTAVARLERGLRLKLLDRNSRTMRLTPEGAEFYRRALGIMEQVREADASAAGMNAEPAGRLSVALPPAFTQEIMAPRLAEFRARFPKVDLDLTVTTHGLGLLRERVDVAVVVGAQADSDLIARKLITGPLIWVTSPAYAEGLDLGPRLEDLRGHIQVCERRYSLGRLPVHLGDRALHLDLSQGVTQVDNPIAVREAVVHGAGIAPLPRHYCRQALEVGRLVEVARHVRFDVAASELSLVYLDRRLVSPRMRVFIDFLVEICAEF